MTKPTTVVSFSNSLDIDGNPVWNDISSYVLSVSINRGKSSDLDSYSSGTASISLNNRSRAFEPNYASSPYYGLIEPFGKVRIVSGGYTEFVGVIDTWSYGYSENGVFATALIQANDNLSVLAKNVLTENTFTAELSGSRVRNILYGTDVYFTDATCIDTGTRTITDDAVAEGASVLDYLQKIGANDGALFYARRDGILAYQDSTLATATGLPFTRKNLVRDSNLAIVPIADPFGTWSGPGVRSTAWAYQGTHSWTNNASADISYFKYDAALYQTNTPYYVSFYLRSSIAQNVTVYAYMSDSSAGDDPDSNVTQSISMGAGEVRRIDLGVVQSKIPVDGLIFGTRLDSGVPATGTIFMDCALVEQTIKLQTYFDGNSTTAAPSGQTYSFSFEGTANNSTSVFTTTVNSLVDFSVVTSITDSNYSGIKFNDVSMVYASEKLYNQITVNGNALESAAGDTASQSQYGLKEYAVTDAILDNQYDNDTLASYLLSLYRVPDYRAESVLINLHNLGTSDQNTILAMDMLSQINLKFLPGNTGTALSGNYLVIGINQSITTEEHMVELRVTSLDNYGFILDHPALGILDTNRLV